MDRDQAIAAAEAKVRAANIGEPELLGDACSTPDERIARWLRRLKSLGIRDEQVREMEKYYARNRPRAEWSISFLLYDERYVDGLTVVGVTIDGLSGEIRLSVYERGK